MLSGINELQKSMRLELVDKSCGSGFPNGWRPFPNGCPADPNRVSRAPKRVTTISMSYDRALPIGWLARQVV